MKGFVIAAVVLFTAGSAAGTNTPCSGKKGGIDRCQGETFICVDGSVSASKKSCIATMGSLGVLGSEASNMAPARHHPRIAPVEAGPTAPGRAVGSIASKMMVEKVISESDCAVSGQHVI